MRDKNRKHISEVIEAYIKQLRIDSKLSEVRLVNDWEKLFGKTINKYTRSMKLSSGVLYIYLSSSVLRQELHFNRESMKDSINQHFGEELVKDIVLR